MAGTTEILTPNLQTVTLTPVDTEKPIVLPDNCSYFTVKHRAGTAAAVITRIAFVTGKVAASTEPFATIEGGQVFNSPEKIGIAGTVFLASATDNVVIEVVAFVGN